MAGQFMVDTIRAHTQHLIEQNRARLDAARIARFTGLPANHRRAFAQRYLNATDNAPSRPLLNDLLAARLPRARLAGHAQHFGCVPL